ncbi:MAG: transposase [bacterium]|nr:transposase [bacterium]
MFKTAKYQPDFPRRFDNLGHANNWCEEFVQWYNFSHYHSNLGGYTPHQVFSGESKSLHAKREQVLQAAYKCHPERFVRGQSKPANPAKVVTINPCINDDGNLDLSADVNFPTLNRVKSNLTAA